MGKKICCSFKYKRSKISTPTPKKLVLSSSTNHTSYRNNLTRTIISYQLENEDSTAIQNTLYISNTDYIQSCKTPRKQNVSIQSTSTPPHLTPLITNLPIAPVEWPKTIELPPVRKEYLCFQVNRKSPHTAQCVKLRILNNSIDYILFVDTF